MKKKIAIVYASRDGQTEKISQRIQARLIAKAQPASLIAISDFSAKQLADFDFVVFGAPIRYGKHLPEMIAFLQQNQDKLAKKNSAFFSVNLTARKANRNTPQTSKYLKKLFATLSWQPTYLEVFAGKLNYPQYRFIDRHMIRFIMWITKGPTDKSTVIEYTSWEKVDHFADQLHVFLSQTS